MKKTLKTFISAFTSRCYDFLNIGASTAWKGVVISIRGTLRTLRNYFITGLIISIPTLITVWVLLWVFHAVDGVLKDPIEWIFGRYYEGIGFATILLMVLILGALGSRVFGRSIIEFMEFQISRVPLIRDLYNGVKQVLQSFSRQESGNFVEVVFIEFPRKGTFTPGLVTNVAYDETGKKIVNVYVPTAPNPTSGFLQILPEDQIIPTTMTVDECMKMVISAGKFSHPDVGGLKIKEPQKSGD